MKTALIVAATLASFASQGASAQNSKYYAREAIVGMPKTPKAPVVPQVKRTCPELALFNDFGAKKINITTRKDTTLAEAAALCSAMPNVTACYRESFSGVFYTTDTTPANIKLYSNGVDHSASICS